MKYITGVIYIICKRNHILCIKMTFRDASHDDNQVMFPSI